MEQKYTVTTNFTVKDNTDEEIRLIEKETYTFADMAHSYARELAIKKDRALILTWFNALGDKELLDVYMLLDGVMKERNININSVNVGEIKIKESENTDAK